MSELHERLARVETTIDNLKETVATISADVVTIRDYVVIQKAKRSGLYSTLTLIGGLVAGGAGLLAAFPGAIAGIFK